MHKARFIPLVLALLGVPVVGATAAATDTPDAHFDRLEARHTGNREMQGALRRLRSSWREYQQAQCFFEKTATAGGAVLKEPGRPARTANAECLARTNAQVVEALAKF